jgi:thioredoxin reductase (NADPH)
VGAEGDDDATLARIRWRSRLAPDVMSLDVRNLFLFVGADPATAWLSGCGVRMDRAGFVLTGVPADGNARSMAPLETTVRGCSRSAMCAQARSSGSAARSARALRW